MVNFPNQIPDCDSHIPALLDLFISSDASICSTMVFPTLGNSDRVVVSVSIDFPINSKQDAPFHCIAFNYSLFSIKLFNLCYANKQRAYNVKIKNRYKKITTH